MAIIPNKLQKQIVNHRCKGTHKFRRFSRKNKTFRLDVYYCANCGFQVKLENIYGWPSVCWRCNKEFNIRLMKLFPTCPDCSGKNADLKLNFKNEAQDWMDENPKDEKVEAIDKDDVIAEIFKKAGIQ